MSWLDATPPRTTVTLVPIPVLSRLATSYGTMALICKAETKIIGAGTLSNNTCVPPSVTSILPLTGVNSKPGAGPMFEPKMLIISPGETGPGAKLAPFTIDTIIGGAAAATVRFTLMVWSPPGIAVDDTTTFPEYAPGASVANTVEFSDKTSGPGGMPEAGAMVPRPAGRVGRPGKVAG